MEALCRLSYSSDARHDTRGVRATMEPMRRFLAPAIVAILGLAACSSPAATCSKPEQMRFDTEQGHPALLVEVANTDAERQHGLSERASLAADHGMAFLFDAPTTVGFWMKDTLIPLSIAFWGADGRIQQTFDMDPCTSDTCQVYRASEPYAGAVEAPQGFFREHGIGVGDKIELPEAGCT